jgi:hypothetical protein
MELRALQNWNHEECPLVVSIQGLSKQCSRPLELHDLQQMEPVGSAVRILPPYIRRKSLRISKAAPPSRNSGYAAISLCKLLA